MHCLLLLRICGILGLVCALSSSSAYMCYLRTDLCIVFFFCVYVVFEDWFVHCLLLLRICGICGLVCALLSCLFLNQEPTVSLPFGLTSVPVQCPLVSPTGGWL